jgi:hypothetical protein
MMVRCSHWRVCPAYWECPHRGPHEHTLTCALAPCDGGAEKLVECIEVQVAITDREEAQK